ncbi:uncharacterized protein LOC143450064 [Clavelina lepadiformis]|uniref:uncharacterized protein LOC143450064 n=1 Tax=Clavelina lepadiformis TaxID=159417 RepID=UPI0040430E61
MMVKVFEKDQGKSKRSKIANKGAGTDLYTRAGDHRHRGIRGRDEKKKILWLCKWMTQTPDRRQAEARVRGRKFESIKSWSSISEIGPTTASQNNTAASSSSSRHRRQRANTQRYDVS